MLDEENRDAGNRNTLAEGGLEGAVHFDEDLDNCVQRLLLGVGGDTLGFGVADRNVEISIDDDVVSTGLHGGHLGIATETGPV